MSKSSARKKCLTAKRIFQCLLALSFALLVCGSFNSAFADDGLVSSNLSKLENKYFQHDFPKDEPGERIERLEKLIYGEARSGSNEDRLKTLMSLVPEPDSKEHDSSWQPDVSKPQEPAPAPDLRRANNNKAMSQANTLPDARTDVDPVPNDSNYPAVTAIEKKLLGRDYVGDSVGKRLDRLEIKAFGKTSASEDLQDRVDRLKSSTGIDIARAKPPNSEWADEDEDPITAGAHGVQPFTGMPPSAPDFSRMFGNGSSLPIPAPAMGVSQQISLLEREVFKKSYDKETILNRLSRLESTVFPQDKPASDKSLPERMNRLLAAVPVSQAAISPAPAKRHRGGDPDFPDLDFDGPGILSSQQQQPQGLGGLSKIINGLGSTLSGGYTGSYATTPGHLVTDPSTGLLYDQYTGTLIDPMTGAVVGRRNVGMGGNGYTGYGGFNSGLSPMSPYGGMGGMGGMGFGFGSPGIRMGGWP